MLVLMDSHHSKKDLKGVIAKIESLGYRAHTIPGAQSTAVGITGNQGAIDPLVFENLPGVKEAIPVSKPYKLSGRDFKHGETRIPLDGLRRAVGAGNFTVIAGPCAVESEKQMLRIARAVKKAGAHMLRGGAFKPRTSPYAFHGLDEEGLRILAKAREETGLPVVTEAVDPRSLDLVCKYADVIQIGARNMQNYALLRLAGGIDRPVLLKRGMSATMDEWLMSAEYILAEGNSRVMLCERGIRTFATHTRNTLDLNVIPAVRKLSHLPVLVDPSHGTGLRDKVAPLARAAAAVGAQGIIIEVHDRPEEALSDGPQALLPSEFSKLVSQLRAMGKVLGYRLG
ncbi:MAG TPA: 3-deoxy-7-phosphoheptulonate synthase [Elusimicrobia bacterium]|nr:3-deoxy-7-phosphoheptulonate synthase [Elusimicrobiota bacterium]